MTEIKCKKCKRIVGLKFNEEGLVQCECGVSKTLDQWVKDTKFNKLLKDVKELPLEEKHRVLYEMFSFNGDLHLDFEGMKESLGVEGVLIKNANLRQLQILKSYIRDLDLWELKIKELYMRRNNINCSKIMDNEISYNTISSNNSKLTSYRYNHHSTDCRIENNNFKRLEVLNNKMKAFEIEKNNSENDIRFINNRTNLGSEIKISELEAGRINISEMKSKVIRTRKLINERTSVIDLEHAPTGQQASEFKESDSEFLSTEREMLYDGEPTNIKRIDGIKMYIKTIREFSDVKYILGRSMNGKVLHIFSNDLVSAHGKTRTEAKNDFRFKLERIKEGFEEKVKEIKANGNMVSRQDYRDITGACSYGVNEFCTRHGIKREVREITVEELLEMFYEDSIKGYGTNYGADKFAKAFRYEYVIMKWKYEIKENDKILRGLEEDQEISDEEKASTKERLELRNKELKEKLKDPDKGFRLMEEALNNEEDVQ